LFEETRYKTNCNDLCVKYSFIGYLEGVGGACYSHVHDVTCVYDVTYVGGLVLGAGVEECARLLMGL